MNTNQQILQFLDERRKSRGFNSFQDWFDAAEQFKADIQWIEDLVRNRVFPGGERWPCSHEGQAMNSLF